MKKLLYVLLVSLLALLLCACAEQNDTSDDASHTHEYGEWTVITAATCTEDGSKERVCACGEKQTENIAATGHGETEIRDAVAATCGADGYTGDTYCKVCDGKIADGDKIPATKEHAFADGVCKECGRKEKSEGLKYELNDDGESYSVTDIGTCTDTHVFIPDSYDGKPVTGIGYAAFAYCKDLTDITIGKNITNVEEYAFYDCSSLTGFELPDGITTIGKGMFSGCAALASITIPDSVTTIGEGAFCACNSLTSVTVPDSVTAVDYIAFSYCENLASVTIGKGLTDLGQDVFAFSPKLTNITVSKENTVYHSEGNCIIQTAAKTLVAGCTGSVIPDDGSVTVIGKAALSCSGLTDITIPDCITEIGYGAFSFCDNLTSITIGKNVASIDDFAFSDCSKLTNINVAKENTVYHSEGNCIIQTATKTLVAGCTNSTIPGDGSVTVIGEHAFYLCKLNSINIPECITEIGKEAFYECENMTSIVFEGTAEQWNSIVKGEDWDTGCGEYTLVFLGDAVKAEIG